MNRYRTFYCTVITIAFSIIWLTLSAQAFDFNNIVLNYTDSPNPGRIHVRSIENRHNKAVKVTFSNEYDGQKKTIIIDPESQTKVDITCNKVTATPLVGGSRANAPIWAKRLYIIKYIPPKKTQAEAASQTENSISTEEQNERNNYTAQKQASPQQPAESRDIVKQNYSTLTYAEGKKEFSTIAEVEEDFRNTLNLTYFSDFDIKQEQSTINNHISNLRNWKDRSAYIAEYHLVSDLSAKRERLKQNEDSITAIIGKYLNSVDTRRISDQDACFDSLQTILNQRLLRRKENIDRLAYEIGESGSEEYKSDSSWISILICLLTIALLLSGIILLIRKSRNKRKRTAITVSTVSAAEASDNIIVRRKTTSILRKQSLEDVIDNNAYLMIDCQDFCDDSAVRRIYIKNSCVKDIYNMYAEDLRNPQNPKEDGCMVLGRWVCDNETKEYYVSLEEIVRPGDDAVMSEYELNFGGKIKLKYTNLLRRLRRETNLQYDLTCWVHSHPGLGVFFSNSDTNVQMQLRNTTNPNFLTAIVIDILTPNQELGIFTFKRDSTMNSKNDLKKLYSLEDMYHWAVESERNSFKAEDYYNTLAGAQAVAPQCSGIELSNGAIIDMSILATEQNAGFVGRIYGFANIQGTRTDYVVEKVSKDENVSDNDLIGYFVVATHCSIPSVRKVVGYGLSKIKFVLIYATTDGLLTSIPVVGGDLCTDEKYYSEQKLEDLKIWTRRKR